MSFLLDFVAEGDCFLDSLFALWRFGVVEKPLEDGERFVVRQRDDQICGEIIGIDVEHQVWKNPKIERFL